MKQITLIFFLFMNSFMALNAQNKDAILIHHTFSSNIESICEETPDGYVSEGIEVYLILKFTNDAVIMLEKEVYSGGSENIVGKLEYKWDLIKDSQIKIYTNPYEIKYHFLKDLVLKIEEGKVIGYKKRGNKKTDKFEFNRIDVK